VTISAKGVGGVEDVFGKLGGEAGELFHDRLEARLLVFRQFGAAEAEITHFVIDDLLLLGAQRRIFGAGAQRLVFVEQLEVLAEFGIEARNLRQHLVVSLTPGRHVIDRMQVADDAPGAAERFQTIGKRARRSPARWPGCCRRSGA
jgi:hypothetical protein